MSRAVAGGTEREPIAVRSTKLNHLVLGRGGGTWAERHLAGRDSLLDALLALYEECSREQLRRDKNVALFLEKCEFRCPMATSVMATDWAWG